MPGGAGGGPWGAGGRPQAGQARGLPIKLTWGGLQLRVVPASKQAHTRTHTVNTGPWQDRGQRRQEDRGHRHRRSTGQPLPLTLDGPTRKWVGEQNLPGEGRAVTGQTDVRMAAIPSQASQHRPQNTGRPGGCWPGESLDPALSWCPELGSPAVTMWPLPCSLQGKRGAALLPSSLPSTDQ